VGGVEHHHQDIGFSQAGTLKETVAVQVSETPDGRTHAELQHLLRVRDLHDEQLLLKRKVDAGVDFLITQLFFDNADFYAFREQAQRAGITVPMIAGRMPPALMPFRGA
jgi:5,10-methylenetetrahydrofolate reductase